MASKNNTSTPEILRKMFGDELFDALSSTPITGEEVDFHDGTKIMLPHNMTYERAYSILERLQKESETPTTFDRRYMYRANDGAYATFQVIKNLYGMILGKPQMSFFGLQPAEQRTIAISPNENMQVPWGAIEIPIFPGLTITLCDQHHDRDYGAIFEIHAVGPKKYKPQVEELFDAVAEYLRTNSIYRGRAISGSASPVFIDLSDFDASQIVFSDEATALLEGFIHAPIRYADAMRREGVPLKRTFLLEGPYGTGKTSEGMIVAEIAVENGWTWISAVPGRDKTEDVLRTAKLYAPAVVFIEDIDTDVSSGEADEVSKFLDAFDGITAKGGEIIAIMTTNHKEKIHKGMLRPGRLDRVIHIGQLDRGGVERLVRALVDPAKLDPAVDFDEIYGSMHGFYPAFVSETIKGAKIVAIGRTQGSGEYVLTTEDLVTAAKSLHEQLKQLEGATEGEKRPSLDTAIGDTVRSALTNGRVAVGNPDLKLVELPQE
jgi:hypothetical protein